MTKNQVSLDITTEVHHALQTRISHISNSRLDCHLKRSDGTVISIKVRSVDIAPFFEVLTLDLALIADAPTLVGTWQSLPFDTYDVSILTREEYITPAEANVDTVGIPRNSQSAARPGAVPREASENCIVDVGLLLTARNGDKLMIAVDWLPLDIVVSRSEEVISRFLKTCKITPFKRHPRA